MIKVLLNGYYRSGSSILWYIMRESNKSLVHVYEPLSPDVDPYIPGSLHGSAIGKAIVEEYAKIDREKYIEIKRSLIGLNNYFLPTSLEQVKPMLDFLNEYECTVQPNNFHFILRDVAKKYGCMTVHLIRNPLDTWIATLPIDPSIKHLHGWKDRLIYICAWAGFKVLPKQTLNVLARSRINRGYYLLGEFEQIKHLFDADVRDYLDMRLYLWTLCNYHACDQADIVISYESLVRSPKRVLRFLERETGIRFNPIPLKRYITNNPALEKEIKKRIERMGLGEYFKELELRWVL